MSNDILSLTLAEVGEAIQTKRLSSTEVTQACLSRIESVGGKLNCFLSLEAEEALRSALEADAALRRGEAVGALHGIPVAAKDIFYRSGKVTTFGSKIFKDRVAHETATVVERMAAAGAVYLGSLHLPEFALGPKGDNGDYGPCRNPWNIDHICGGSSSGSAAAVAARLLYGSLGTDPGGSARMPAGLCGVVALKPTHGRVSRHGVMPLAFSLDAVAPLTRTVRDCARLASVISGADPRDPTCRDEPVPDYEASLENDIRGLRIGVAKDQHWPGLDPEVNRLLDDSLDVLGSLGAHIVALAIPEPDEVIALADTILVCEAASQQETLLLAKRRDYPPSVRRRLEPGLYMPAARYLEAVRLRGRLTAEFLESVFTKVDLLHVPLSSIAAPTAAEVEADDAYNPCSPFDAAMRRTRPFNYLGLPVLSVPCGFVTKGLPVGFQLVAPPFREATVLNVGHAYQSATAWHQRSPDL